MTPETFLSDVAAVYFRGPDGEAFGSGRLIAPGLVLTAGHVVDDAPDGESRRTGWKVWLLHDRAAGGAPGARVHDAERIWRGGEGLDLAVLRLCGDPPRAPRVRPVFASWDDTGSIDMLEAAGFPQAWRTEADLIREYIPGGALRNASQHGPYGWTVPPGDKPDSRDGWKGMSGSAACKVAPDGSLHVFGVVQSVPAQFSGGLLEVARLSEAFAVDAFRQALRDSLGHEPALVRWLRPDGRTAPGPNAAGFRSTIPALGNRPFVNRDPDPLAEIGLHLRDPSRDAAVVLHGPPGVGKSELALEYGRRRQGAYPGGTFRLDATGETLVIELARLGQFEFPEGFPAGWPIADQAQWTLRRVWTRPTLLIYDNVQSEAALEPCLPPAGTPCHVVATSLLDRWDARLPAIEVPRLTAGESLDLIAGIAGQALARRYGGQLAGSADGLPVQLVPASATLAHEARRGRVRMASRAALDPKAASSFEAAYRLLEPPAQVLLHAAARLNPQRIPREELQRQMKEALQWDADEFDSRLDACLDLQVLKGSMTW
nr:hypothetical protein [uncultured Rhodopila sp.]